MRDENKVDENKVSSYREALRYMKNIIKTIKRFFSFMSNLQTYYHFQLYFQK